LRANAIIITINPTSDGSLYTCSGCNTIVDGSYLLVSGYIQGAVKFSSATINGRASNALLSFNPYGLPLWGKVLNIYGYGSSIGTLVNSDANAGDFLGSLSLPDNLDYGQDVFFDVTQFINNINSPFIAFNLRSVSTDVFSSLEYNYGHPSQLIISTVSEPIASILLVLGLIGVSWRRTKK